jgi:hypothetical protein
MDVYSTGYMKSFYASIQTKLTSNTNPYIYVCRSEHAYMRENFVARLNDSKSHQVQSQQKPSGGSRAVNKNTSAVPQEC